MALGASRLTGLARYQAPAAGGSAEGYIAFTSGTSPYQEFYKVDSGNVDSYDLLSGEPDTTVTVSAHYGSGAWHPDGTYYCCVAPSKIELWSRSGDSFTKLTTPSVSTVSNMAGGCVWSLDGNYVAIPGTNGTLYIKSWNGTTLSDHQTITGLGPNPMWSCAFHPNSNRMVVVGDTQVRLVTLSGSTWASSTQIQSGSRIFDADYSSDGNWLATVDINGVVRVYAISGDTYTLNATLTNSGSGRTVAFSPDSKLILVNAGLKAHGYNGSSWVNITAPTGGVASDKRTISFNGAGTHFILKPDSGQPKMWSISGSGSSSTFTAISTPFSTNISAITAGGGMFIDSPQNF